MADTLTQTRPVFLCRTKSDLVTCATMATSLVECACYLAMTDDPDARHHITDLLIIISERAQALQDMLEEAEVVQ